MTNDSETSQEKAPNVEGAINVLPVLADAKAPVSITLTIDRSVKKIAVWVMVVIAAGSAIIGAACILMVWVIVTMRDEAREHRLVDDDYQKMNAYLQAQGVTKDENGFFTLGKPEDRKAQQAQE